MLVETTLHQKDTSKEQYTKQKLTKYIFMIVLIDLLYKTVKLHFKYFQFYLALYLAMILTIRHYSILL